MSSFSNLILEADIRYLQNVTNLTVTVNSAEVADCRKVKCRLTRFQLRRNENSKFNENKC